MLLHNKHTEQLIPLFNYALIKSPPKYDVWVDKTRTMVITPTPSRDVRPTRTMQEKEQALAEIYADKTLAEMEIEEKISQMFIFPLEGEILTKTYSNSIQTTQPGGVIVMEDNVSEQLPYFIENVQDLQKHTPLFVATDQEGGNVKRLAEDANPGHQELGIMDEKSTCQYIKQTARLLEESNINVNLGIIADIGWYDNAYISPRTFGGDLELVTEKVAQAVRCHDNVYATIKHFPGHGSTVFDSHYLIPKIDTPFDEWKEKDFVPFRTAMEYDIPFVMMGHLIYEDIDSQPASLSRNHVNFLRDSGFEGIIITDDIGMLETSGIDTYEAVDRALEAGVDMILVTTSSEDSEDIILHARQQIRTGLLSEEDVDMHVHRILTYKYPLTTTQKP